VVVSNRVMLAGMISNQKDECENEIDGDPKKEAAPGCDLMCSLIPQGWAFSTGHLSSSPYAIHSVGSTIASDRGRHWPVLWRLAIILPANLRPGRTMENGEQGWDIRWAT